jgi:hypothetical protein
VTQHTGTQAVTICSAGNAKSCNQGCCTTGASPPAHRSSAPESIKGSARRCLGAGAGGYGPLHSAVLPSAQQGGHVHRRVSIARRCSATRAAFGAAATYPSPHEQTHANQVRRGVGRKTRDKVWQAPTPAECTISRHAHQWQQLPSRGHTTATTCHRLCHGALCQQLGRARCTASPLQVRLQARLGTVGDQKEPSPHCCSPPTPWPQTYASIHTPQRVGVLGCSGTTCTTRSSISETGVCTPQGK